MHPFPLAASLFSCLCLMQSLHAGYDNSSPNRTANEKPSTGVFFSQSPRDTMSKSETKPIPSYSSNEKPINQPVQLSETPTVIQQYSIEKSTTSVQAVPSPEKEKPSVMIHHSEIQSERKENSTPGAVKENSIRETQSVPSTSSYQSRTEPAYPSKNTSHESYYQDDEDDDDDDEVDEYYGADEDDDDDDLALNDDDEDDSDDSDDE